MNNGEQFFNKPAGGYSIQRSIRLNAPDSAHLSRTPASAGDRKTWTWAGWVKRSALATGSGYLFSADRSSFETILLFNSSDQIDFYNWISNAYAARKITTQVFRDPSSWYHIVAVWDSDNATANDKMRLYVNGTRVDAFGTSTNPTSGELSTVNDTYVHQLCKAGSSAAYFNGYLADIHFIDGQALDSTSFGEFDATTGVWVPIEYTGTYGTNGFHLDFADNSSNTATTLGKDTSPNGNNWTPNNFAVSQNPIYSSFLTTNGAKTGWFGGTPAQAFDSSTTTFVQGALGGDVTFTPSAPIPVGTLLRIWADSGSGSGIGSSGYQIIYNGTTIYNASAMWTSPFTITAAPGTSLSSLVIDTSAGGEAMRLFAVEVDSVILVDGAGAGNDSLVDVPTNGAQTDTGAGGEVRGNYCTLNPLDQRFTDNGTISNGNLDYVQSSTGSRTARCTIGVSSGKWYWEFTHLGGNASHGISKASSSLGSFPGGADADGWSWFAGGNIYNNSASTATYAGLTYTTNDVIGLALDLDAGTLTYYKNGVSQGTAVSGLTGTWFPSFGSSGVVVVSMTANFGQRPFAYTAPSGFKALNTANLPAPLVTKPSTLMDIKLYTGNGSTQTISGLGFSPDLVWIKSRSFAESHRLLDTIRTATKVLYSDLTNAEGTDSTGLTAFNSDGFTLGSSTAYNQNSSTYAAWCWDAGTTTSTNDVGSISSQVRANASAGFSVVTYTGTGSSATIGHGLGVAPQFFLIKRRNATSSWIAWHTSIGNSDILRLESTNATQTISGFWQNTRPTSSLIYLDADGTVNGSGGTYVAYCFAPVAGYSSFGSYVGNGSSDGVFVYTGFRPAFVLFKATNAVQDWVIYDTKRDTYNVASQYLFPNSSAGEASFANLDFLSNGFKLRSTISLNTSGYNFIYAAFAEHPFQYARAR